MAPSPLVRLVLVAQLALFIGASAQPVKYVYVLPNRVVEPRQVAQFTPLAAPASNQGTAKDTTENTTKDTTNGTANNGGKNASSRPAQAPEAKPPPQGMIETTVPKTDDPLNKPANAPEKAAEETRKTAAPEPTGLSIGQIAGIVVGAIVAAILIASVALMCLVNQVKREPPVVSDKPFSDASSTSTCVGDLEDEIEKCKAFRATKFEAIRAKPKPVAASEPSFYARSLPAANFQRNSVDTIRPNMSNTKNNAEKPVGSPVRRLMAAMALSPRPQTAPHRLQINSNRTTRAAPQAQLSVAQVLTHQPSTPSQLSPYRTSPAGPSPAATSAGSTWRFKQFITLTPKTTTSDTSPLSPSPNEPMPLPTLPMAQPVTPIGNLGVPASPMARLPYASPVTPVGLALGSPLPDSMQHTAGPAPVQRDMSSIPIIATPTPPSRQPTRIHIAAAVQSPESPSPMSATSAITPRILNAFPRSPLDPEADDVDVRALPNTTPDGHLAPAHGRNRSISFSVISVHDPRDSIIDSYTAVEEVLDDQRRRW